MNNLRLPTLLFVLLLVVIIACCVSCSDSSFNAPPTSKNLNLRQGTAKPGYGFPSCHIGMSIDDLAGTWQKEAELFPSNVDSETKEDRPVLYNVSEGIFLGHEKGNIRSLNLNYRSQDVVYANFDGRTEEGIDRSSTVLDVFESYGEPDSLTNIEQADTGRRIVRLNYYLKGLIFEFSDGKISSFSIFAQQSFPLDPFFIEDIGDARALRQLAGEVSRRKAESNAEE